MLQNSGTTPRLFREGLRLVMETNYMEKPKIWSQIYSTLSSKKQQEEFLEVANPPYATVGTEGSSIPYDIMQELGKLTVRHSIIKLGMKITREAMDDNLYPSAFNHSRAISDAFTESKEILLAEPFNKAFSTDILYIDGKPMIATDHPCGFGSVQSNKLSTAAQISEQALEDIMVMLMTAKRNNGQQAMLSPKAIMIHPNLYHNVMRLTKSKGRPDTANNDINVLATYEGKLGNVKIISHSYLESTESWYILTNVPKDRGFLLLQRTGFETMKDNCFDTQAMKIAGYERYGRTMLDFRAIYGSQVS